jgi:hypothetical protein
MLKLNGPLIGPKLKLLSSDLTTTPLIVRVLEVRPPPRETPSLEYTKLEEDEELDELDSPLTEMDTLPPPQINLRSFFDKSFRKDRS